MSTARDVFTPSRLNREVRALLEGHFPLIWIEGELSNLARPRSGHLYFSLKDEQAQVRCAMFRSRNQHLRFRPRDGDHVLLRARVGLYEGRGEFQLVVEHMEEAGEGLLRRRFEELRDRLAAEGLFDAARKRPLPAWPRQVAVVTSASGAALHDVLSVLARRFPALPVLVAPVPVQGPGAAEQIVQAIGRIGARGDSDVVLLVRGGGSLEDLQAFNEEAVARAIRACPVPVVSGVGHEVDFTIADLAADHRAPTPSAAAELVSPDREAIASRLRALEHRLLRRTLALVEASRLRLAGLEGRLLRIHPRARLQQHMLRLDELDRRLGAAVTRRLAADRQRWAAAHGRLLRVAPAVAPRRQRLGELERRLRSAMHAGLGQRRRRLESGIRALGAVSPLATLERGYSILRRDRDGRLITRAEDVATGDHIHARLAHGSLRCRVEETAADEG